MKSKLLINKKDFTLLEIVFKKEKGKLGNIHKATLRGEEMLCKVINLERVNNFQIESFLECQCILAQTPVKNNLTPLTAFYFDNDSFYLFFPRRMSLFQLIHEQQLNKQISYLDKIVIIRELSRILFNIHSLGIPIVHGHLTSHNIFVEFDKLYGIQVFLGDLEVSSLLKYANLFISYQIASVWSAPEVMSQARITDLTKEMDIYSFGVVVWELLHN